MCRAALRISFATLLVCRAALRISIATLLICRAALRISIATLLICRAALRIAMAFKYSMPVQSAWISMLQIYFYRSILFYGTDVSLHNITKFSQCPNQWRLFNSHKIVPHTVGICCNSPPGCTINICSTKRTLILAGIVWLC